MSIQYIKGDLFSAQGCFLLHACNCRRNWGSGVAAQFARIYPGAYKQHQTLPANKPGEFQLLPTPSEIEGIICLFTSNGYGRYVDPPETILQNTKTALMALGDFFFSRNLQVRIASPKINAGLFNVPWEQTEKLINSFVSSTTIPWDVYHLD